MVQEKIEALRKDRQKAALNSAIRYDSNYPCDFDPHYQKDRRNLGNMVWHPEGSSIFVLSQQNIWEIQADGSGAERIIDPDPPTESREYHRMITLGFHIDISPEGSQLVYSTCEYPVERPGEAQARRNGIYRPTDSEMEKWKASWKANETEENRVASERWSARIAEVKELERLIEQELNADNRKVIGYELGIFNLENMEKRRLTKDNVMNHLPAWSPDGNKIAYLTNSQSPLEDSKSTFLSGDIYLAVITPDSDRHPVQPERWTNYDYSFPPVWSPDGRYIAMPSYEHHPSGKSAVNVIPANDLSSRTRLGETTAQPAWSPDSARIAFANEQEIYTVNPDGTELKHIWTEENHINHLDWHPDGSEILVTALRLFSITPEGEEIRNLAGPASPEIRARAGAEASESRRLFRTNYPKVFERAIWSPDGTRLAAVIWENRNHNEKLRYQVSSITRDGSSVHTMAAAFMTASDFIDRVKHLANPNPPQTSRTDGDRYDAGECENPKVVDQNSGPKLIEDCRTLLEMASKMALKETLNWGRELPITEWEGIRLGQVNEEMRVVGIDLYEQGLDGTIPPEIGKLTGLQVLDLQNLPETEENKFLGGPIPPEMGNLSELGYLNLAGNSLTGEIPTEIGNLPKLRHLDLEGNNLTGTVPENLNGLKKLGELNLKYNYLRGCISKHLAELIPIESIYYLKNITAENAGQAAAEAGLSICGAEE